MKDFWSSVSLKKWDASMQTLIYILGITILIIIPFPGIHLPMRWWENVQPGKGTIGHFFNRDYADYEQLFVLLCPLLSIITSEGSGTIALVAQQKGL